MSNYQKTLNGDGVEHVSFSGLNEPCSVGSLVEVVINASNHSISLDSSNKISEVEVFAIMPSGISNKCQIESQRTNDNIVYTATFAPTEVGDWQIAILYDGQHIKDSPFKCLVFDPNLVFVYGLDVGLVGQELNFTVDAAKAGYGKLNVTILNQSRQIPSYIRQEEGQDLVYKVQFTPNGSGQYNIHVTFNGVEVIGSPFILDIADANSASVHGDQLRMAAVGRIATFFVHVLGADTRDISATVTGPRGLQNTRVVPLDESTFKVEWKPVEIGEHLINIAIFGQNIYDSPYICNVGDPDLVTIKKLPNVIEENNLNMPHSFEIDATAAGSGNLEIVINGGRVACRVIELSKKKFKAQFKPVKSTKHVIEMKFNGEHVLNSPFILPFQKSLEPSKETSNNSERLPSPAFNSSKTDFEESHNEYELVGAGLSKAAILKSSFFEIKSSNLNIENLLVRIEDPDGKDVPVKIYEKTHALRCEYKLLKVGEHQLQIFVNGRLADSGPLFISGYDPDKVFVQPVGDNVVGEPVQFFVDAVEAGKGQLEISVNQGQVPNNVQMQDAGRCLVTFIPQYSGTYVIDVTFNNQQVHGCPIKVDVHNKQIGKPVSAPIFSNTEGAGIGGTSPPFRGGLSSLERGSSSAYFSASSPRQLDSSYAPSPASPLGDIYPQQYQHQQINRQSSRDSPRSPPLVAHIEQQRAQSPPILKHSSWAASEEHSHQLRSPRLVCGLDKRSAASIEPQQEQENQNLLGYTVAQYGEGAKIVSENVTSPKSSSSYQQPISLGSNTTNTSVTTKKYFGGHREPVVPETDYSLSDNYSEEVKPHKYFDKLQQEAEDNRQQKKYNRHSHVHEQNNSPDSEIPQFEITRSSELTLYQDRSEGLGPPESSHRRFPPIDTIDVRDVKSSPFQAPQLIHEESSFIRRQAQPQNIYEEIPEVTRREVERKQSYPKPEIQIEKLYRVNDLPYFPLNEQAKETLRFIRKNTDEKHPMPSQQQKYSQHEQQQRNGGEFVLHNLSEQQTSPQQHALHYTHIVEPYSSDIEALTPITGRKLVEHSLKESEEPHATEPFTHIQEPETIPATATSIDSKSQSKPTTPRLSLKKFSRSSSTSSSKGGKDGISTGVGTNGFDFGKSKITSKNEVVKKGKEVEVKIESLKLGKEDQLKVVVMPPSRGKTGQTPELPHRLKKSGKTFEVLFRPTEVGTHKVLVFINNQYPHPQTPFPIRVYDAAQILVGDIIRESLINDTVEFTVDAGRAGFGNLEMAIKDSDGVIIPSHVSQLEAGTAKFLVTFNPTSVGTHTVNITFNKEIIQGSPFNVNIVDSLLDAELENSLAEDSSTLESKKKEKSSKKEKKKDRNSSVGKSSFSLRDKDSFKKGGSNSDTSAVGGVVVAIPTVTKFPSLSRVGKIVELHLTLPESDNQSKIDVNVRDSDQNSLEKEIIDEQPNWKRIQFIPTRVGDHEIELKINGVNVNGSPCTCRAYDPAKIHVGTISDGIVNRAVHFTVDASEAGVGNLEVAVNDGKIPSMAHALGQHKYDISFVPRENIDHHITVRFNNESVPGSPFLCRLVTTQVSIAASGPGLERSAIGQQAEFWITLPEGFNKNLSEKPSVEIIDSTDALIESEVRRDNEDPSRFHVTYTPHHVGNHLINIHYGKEAVFGAPFTAKAFDAGQARLALNERAQVGKPCTFTIDAAKAGAGNMEIIVSVGQRNVPNFVQAEGQAKFKVSFTPQEETEHIVSVKFNGIPVPGSPLHCPVSGADATTSSLPKSLSAVNPPTSRIYASNVEESASSTVLSSTNGQEEIRLVGDLAVAQVGKIKRFSIDAPEGRRNTECNVIVSDSENRKIPVDIRNVSEGFDVEFLPILAGIHKIDIQIDGKSLERCPIVCKVFDFKQPSSLDLKCGHEFRFEVDLPNLKDYEKVHAEITSTQKDSKMSQNLISKLVPSTIQKDLQNKRAIISFKTDNLSKNYFVAIYYNEMLLEERIYSSTDLNSYLSKSSINFIHFPNKALVEHLSEFEFEIIDNNFAHHNYSTEAIENRLNIEIFDPNNRPLTCTIQELDVFASIGHVFGVEWEPLREGRHIITINFDDKEMNGPLYVDVLDLSTVRVIGLRSEDFVGVTQNFNLDWSYSGGSTAKVRISHELLKHVECHIKKVKKGLYVCSFTPLIPGLYLLDIFVDDMKLPECPYECIIKEPAGTVQAYGYSLFRTQCGKSARFEIAMGGIGGGDLDVLITDARNSPLPVRCFKQADDSYWVEFTPEKAGTHKIQVTFADIPINGSPFHCEAIDTRNVIIRGLDESFTLRNIANINIDRQEAGNGDLEVEILDSHGHALKIEKVKTVNGEDSFTFLPSKLGAHKLHVRIGGFIVPGTPKTFHVEEPSQPSVYGSALDYAVENGQQASLIFDPKKQKGGLKVEVKGPISEGGDYLDVDLKKVRHTTNRRPDGSSEIAFKPLQVGRYAISFEFNNKTLPGSPFHVDVVDPTKVLIDPQHLRMEDNTLRLIEAQSNIINVDATAAGPGKLRAELREGSGGSNESASVSAPLVHNLGYGKFQVELKPRAGLKSCRLYFYWSELVVPTVYPLLSLIDTSPGVEDTNIETTKIESKASVSKNSATITPLQYDKIILSGKGLTHAVVKELAEFLIDCSALPESISTSQLGITLCGDKADIPVRINPLEGRSQVFKALYTPLVGGKYNLNIIIDGHPLPGANRMIDVQSYSNLADLIDVDTKTLKIGIIGEDVQTIIDARRAGPGNLSAQCAGPTQAEYCELFDKRDGTYVLRITPKELGRHALTLKYAGEHVRGSPFVFNVANPPDATQVRVYGSGIEHGILHSFKSNFVVETKGAGAGQLTVRVRGPKGAFNVEMQRDRQQERTIHCKYEPKEPGDYQVEVKWQNQHVPGSPFLILIVDTESELQRFLAGGAPSPPPITPFVPPGWSPAGLPAPPTHFRGGRAPLPQSIHFPSTGPPPPIHPMHAMHQPIYGGGRSHSTTHY